MIGSAPIQFSQGIGTPQSRKQLQIESLGPGEVGLWLKTSGGYPGGHGPLADCSWLKAPTCVGSLTQQGNSHLIHFYWLLSSSPSIVVMESVVDQHVLHLFPTHHFAPSPTADCHNIVIARGFDLAFAFWLLAKRWSAYPIEDSITKLHVGSRFNATSCHPTGVTLHIVWTFGTCCH